MKTYDFYCKDSGLFVFTNIKKSLLREMAAEAFLLNIESPDFPTPIPTIDTIKAFCQNSRWSVIRKILKSQLGVTVIKAREED